VAKGFTVALLAVAVCACGPQAVATAPSVTASESASAHARGAAPANVDPKLISSALRSPYFANAGVAMADEDGRLLYARNAARAYAPASAIKTIVAAVALAKLGPQARLDTTFESLAPPDDRGTIGDLWLVGGGDPYLDPAQLSGGVGALYRSGVRKVDGDVIVDATSFSGPEQNPAWAPDDLDYGYAAGTSAISLNWNVVEFRIQPTQIGEPAKVRVFPEDPGIVVEGAPITAYSTNFRIERVAAGRNEFKIDGTIAYGWEQKYYRPVAGIPQWVGDVTVEILRRRGIEVSGGVKLGGDPLAMDVLWDHRSPPLATMVFQMLHESDNHIAEQLFRVLGSGTDSSAAQKEGAYLRGIGIPTPGLHIVDGSGLAETNRVAPVTFVRLLQAAAHSRIGDDYVKAFPRAGIEGTVRHHQLSTALGRVRAKSGHIAGVNALVGYVQTAHSGRLAFAFLVNAPGADDATSIQVGIDRVLDTLAAL
jgi:D-alanyl-D-alanine carboxypeptidase/D-alanyl-D-alanine-endopeptidase (penicillin-binding protein 4)